MGRVNFTKVNIILEVTIMKKLTTIFTLLAICTTLTGCNKNTPISATSTTSSTVESTTSVVESASSGVELTWDYVENALNNGDTADMSYTVSDVYEDNGNKCFDVEMVYKDEFSMCSKNTYETDGTYLGSVYSLKACDNYSFEDLSVVTYFGEIERCSDTELVSTLQTLEGMVSLEEDKRLIERQVADIQSMHSFQDSYNQLMEELINVDITLSDKENYKTVTIYADTTYCLHVTNADGMVACQTTDTELMEINPSGDNTLEVKPLKNGNGKITISDTKGNSCVVTVYINMN